MVLRLFVKGFVGEKSPTLLKMKIVNFFGGPNSGKSILSSLTYARLGCLGFNTEVALEFAKELTNEGRMSTLQLQFYVTGKQAKRIAILRDTTVDFVVTDSPILTGLAYGGFACGPSFSSYVVDLHNCFDNINILVVPDTDIQHQQFGRSQTADEAYLKRAEVKELLDTRNIPYLRVVNSHGFDNAVELVKSVIVPHITE